MHNPFVCLFVCLFFISKVLIHFFFSFFFLFQFNRQADKYTDEAAKIRARIKMVCLSFFNLIIYDFFKLATLLQPDETQPIYVSQVLEAMSEILQLGGKPEPRLEFW